MVREDGAGTGFVTFYHCTFFCDLHTPVEKLAAHLARRCHASMRSASAAVPPEQLKPVLHEKIERMNTRRHGVEQKATKKEIPGL